LTNKTLTKKLTKEGVDLWNAIKNASGKTYQIGNTVVNLDKGGLAHILGRHHPKYFVSEGAKVLNTMFPNNYSINDVVTLLGNVMKTNPKLVEKIKNGGSGKFNYNGKKYQVGFRDDGSGHIGQFHLLE
jgi:hypothetical protein